MGAVIFKQPNGLYGRYSYTSDGFTHINMTKEEYCILKLEDHIRESKRTIERNLYDYNTVKKDALKYVNYFDEWIKESDDEKEQEELKAEKEKEKEERLNIISSMENEIKINKKERDFYKELLKLIENLTFYYKDSLYGERKKYLITENPKDMVEMTKKLKELNTLYKEWQKQKTK